MTHTTSLDSFVNEAFVQHQYVMTRDECKASHFAHYTTHVATHYKTIFFAKQGNCMHQYMLEPIPLYAIQTIASMPLSHTHCDVRQGVGAHVMRVVNYAYFALNKWESKCHTLIQCTTFDYI